MYTKCQRCGKILKDPGHDFACRSCGFLILSREKYLVEDDEEMPPVAFFRERIHDFGIVRAIIFLIVDVLRILGIYTYAIAILLCIFTLAYGAWLVGICDANQYLSIYMITPKIVPIYSFTGGVLKFYYIVLVFAIFSSFIYIIIKEINKTVKICIESFKTFRAPARKEKNTFIAISQVFLAVFAFNTLYSFILYSNNIEPSSPSFGNIDIWYLHILFANAAVYEELIARIILIGAPLFIFYSTAYFIGVKHTNVKLKEYLESKCGGKWYRFAAGGGFEIGLPEIQFLIISSIFFALAHYYGGWDMWKILPTFVAGLGMGYLFLRKGIHAAIILHFSFDYLGLAMIQFNFVSTYIAPLAIIWFIPGLFYIFHYTGIINLMEPYIIKMKSKK